MALLGKAITRGRAWRPLGLAAHALNGAMFGLALHEARGRIRVDQRRLAVAMALAEHVTLSPLYAAVDRWHPASGEAGVPKLHRNGRAFAQATWRHLLFGVVLGRLA